MQYPMPASSQRKQLRAPAGLAAAAAVLGTVLALALPRLPAASNPGTADGQGWRPQPPELTALAAPGLIDAFTDDEGHTTLLSDEPTQEGGRARAAWLVAPGWRAFWEGQRTQAGGETGTTPAPGVLTVTGPGGSRSQIRLEGAPSLLAAVRASGGGGAAQAQSQKQTHVQGAAQTPPFIAVLPAILREDAGTAQARLALPDADGRQADGDRVLLLSGAAQRELFRAPAGAVTALAAGPASQGTGSSIALSWVEAGRPPTSALALLDTSGREIWRAGLSRPAHRLALVEGGRVIAASGQDLIALEDGQVVWRRQMPEPPVALQAAPGGLLLVALPDRLLCLAANGFTVWEVRTGARTKGMRLSPEGNRGVLIEAGQAELFSLMQE